MNIKIEGSSQQQEPISSDVQSYLIDNYREAVRQGDRNAAKSYLLAARYFSTNDPIVMYEIYLMAKTEGDISEASRCFVVLTRLLSWGQGQDNESSEGTSSETMTVIGKIKDEIAAYLNQLKTKSLHLKAKPPSLSSKASLASSTEYRTQPRASSSTSLAPSEITFFQQLVDQVPADTNRNILDHAIRNCQDKYEQCRLMLLSMSICPDSAETHGCRCVTKLLDMIRTQTSPEEALPREYARSLLVLDTLPSVLKAVPLSKLDVDIRELFVCVLSYYSSYCLSVAAKEHEYSDLTNALKMSIADRILCKESSNSEMGAIQDILDSTLDLLYEKYQAELPDPLAKEFFSELEDVLSRGPLVLDERLGGLVDAQFATSSTPEPRTRPRGKKGPQKPNANEPYNPSTLHHVIFYTVVRRIFKSSAVYLRETRTRIIMDFDNPLQELQHSAPSDKHPLCRLRSPHVEVKSEELHEGTSTAMRRSQQAFLIARELGQPAEDSPLNSTYSRSMDDEIISNICTAKLCLDIIVSREPLKSYWHDFLGQTLINTQEWYRRMIVDTSMFKNEYDEVCKALSDLVLFATDPQESQVAAQSYPDVVTLRALVQFICCEVQQSTSHKALPYIDYLLTKLRQCGIAGARDNYAMGDVTDEYKILVCQGMGYLFFDAVPIIRYCVDVLTSILYPLLLRDEIVPDTLVGHTIVLCQFDWPKNAHIYEKCIELIRMSKPKSVTPQCLSNATKFTYPEFFQYVKNPSFIEDFMAFLNQGYTLDLKDNSSVAPQAPVSQPSTSRASSGAPTRASKAIMTRGVNKSFKEDLKVALTAQMKNSMSFFPLDMTLEFLQAFLIPYMLKIR